MRRSWNRIGILLAMIIAFLGIVPNQAKADWTYNRDAPAEATATLPANVSFPVARCGSTYYSTIDAAFQDHSSTGNKANTEATIYILPTDEIISKAGLARTVEVFNAINQAKTLTTSVTLGTNKKISLPYTGTTELTIDQSKTGTEYGDNSAANMGKNLKNVMTIGPNIHLKIPYSSSLVIGAILSQTNSALCTSCVFSSYSQITMKESSKLTVNGTLQCYGYIKESYDAQGTTNVYLTGESGKVSTLDCPLNIHQTIGGSATSSCGSNNVWPYNIYTVASINSTLHLNYYSKVQVTAYVMVSSSRYEPSTTLYSNSAGMFIAKTSNSSLSWFHTQNAYIAEKDLVQKDSSGNVINVLDRVSTTSLYNYQRKTYVNVYGDIEVGRITLKIVITVDTNDYYLPFSYEYQITLKENSSLVNNYRLCFLPGSTLTVEKNAHLTLNNHTLFLTKRKNSAGYILAAVGSGNGVQKYPVVTTNEDNLAEIDCEVENAKLYNAGIVTINKGFGGKIYAYDKTFDNNTTSSITFGANYENIGASSASNSSSCPRFYSTTSALKTYGFYQSNAYFRLFDGSNLNYLIPTSGTYVGYRRQVGNTYQYGWVANSASIHYDANGASNTYQDKSIDITSAGYAVTTADLPNETPSRPYYTFGGWFLNGDENKPISGSNSYVTYVGVSIVAKWNPIDYNVVYHFDKDHNGNQITGTATNTNPATFNVESDDLLENAIYEDNRFDGWYLNSDYTGKVSSLNSLLMESVNNSGELHLYGRWYPASTPVWRITYVKNNDDEQITCKEYEDIISDNTSNLSVPNLSVYNNDLEYDKYFDGWYLDDTLQTKYTSYTQITGDQTLYAKWNAKNTISICVQGGAVATRYLKKDATFTIPDLASVYSGFSLPSVTGYDLKWDITGGPLDGTIHDAGETITLTDDWGESISVNYDYVPKSYTMSITIGAYQTTVISITHNGNTVSYTYNKSGQSSGISDTKAVYTGDTITISVTNDSDKTSGGEVTVTNLSEDGSTNNTYTVNGNGDPTIETSDASAGGSCLLPETLVTLADGTTKKAKDIKKGDKLLSFSHITGEFEAREVIANIRVEAKEQDVITLSFDNGHVLRVACGHGLFNLDRNNYEIYYGEEFYDHIGESFVCVDDSSGQPEAVSAKLVGVEIHREVTEKYTPLSEYNINCVADGLLTIPDDIEGMLSSFEYDENLMINQALLAQQIAEYGLYSYDSVSHVMPEYAYEVFNFKYWRIFVAMGTMTLDQIDHFADVYLPQIIETNGLDWDWESRQPMPVIDD